MKKEILFLMGVAAATASMANAETKSTEQEYNKAIAEKTEACQQAFNKQQIQKDPKALEAFLEAWRKRFEELQR